MVVIYKSIGFFRKNEHWRKRWRGEEGGDTDEHKEIGRGEEWDRQRERERERDRERQRKSGQRVLQVVRGGGGRSIHYTAAGMFYMSDPTIDLPKRTPHVNAIHEETNEIGRR